MQAKKCFAEQHAFLNQESYLDAPRANSAIAVRVSLFPGLRHPFQDSHKNGVGVHALRFRFEVQQHAVP